LRRSLVPDTPPYVELTVEGSDLVVRTRAPSARTVRATFEDLLACVQAAERTARSAAETK
jgi:hypothetical protein